MHTVGCTHSKIASRSSFRILSSLRIPKPLDRSNAPWMKAQSLTLIRRETASVALSKYLATESSVWLRSTFSRKSSDDRSSRSVRSFRTETNYKAEVKYHTNTSRNSRRTCSSNGRISGSWSYLWPSCSVCGLSFIASEITL